VKKQGDASVDVSLAIALVDGETDEYIAVASSEPVCTVKGKGRAMPI